MKRVLEEATRGTHRRRRRQRRVEWKNKEDCVYNCIEESRDSVTISGAPEDREANEKDSDAKHGPCDDLSDQGKDFFANEGKRGYRGSDGNGNGGQIPP